MREDDRRYIDERVGLSETFGSIWEERGVYSFGAGLRHLTIDHASFSRQGREKGAGGEGYTGSIREENNRD